MKQCLITTLLIMITTNLAYAAEDSDWPTWRGPNGNGIVSDEQVPLKWSESENILWKADIPGRGNSSPIVVGSQIFLTTADERQQIQSIVSFDRKSGDELWKADIHSGNFIKRSHKMCTNASCSVACDGKLIFATFMNGNAIYTTAVDMDGKQVWQTKVSDFKSQFGYGASPTLYDSYVLVAVDNAPGNTVVALDRRSGDIVWKADRPRYNSFVTPLVFKVDGKDQLLMSGCNLVAGYDPKTGKELWSAKAGAQMTVGSVVTNGKLVFASGGWPQKVTVCVEANSGEVVWSNKAATYIPAMLVHDDHLYAVTNNGMAYCWKADTGDEAWKSRLGGNYSASPLLVNDHILVPSESGVTKVFKANPQKFELVSENSLSGLTRATPAICGNKIFLRIADRLYCVGSSKGS